MNYLTNIPQKSYQNQTYTKESRFRLRRKSPRPQLMWALLTWGPWAVAPFALWIKRPCYTQNAYC